MAKIVGPVPPFIGTRDNVTIYRMNGEYIARTKSSLTGKRVKKDPAFVRTMEWAHRLKQGARIASTIYRQMPVEGRVYKQYREITGKAMSLLKEGFGVEDVITMLEAVYVPQLVETSERVIAGIKPGAERENNSAHNSAHNSARNSTHNSMYIPCNQYCECDQCSQFIQRDKKVGRIKRKTTIPGVIII